MASIKQNKMKMTSYVIKEENISQNQKKKQSTETESSMAKMLKNKILKPALITDYLYELYYCTLFFYFLMFINF